MTFSGKRSEGDPRAPRGKRANPRRTWDRRRLRIGSRSLDLPDRERDNSPRTGQFQGIARALELTPSDLEQAPPSELKQCPVASRLVPS